jgi:hypothetical protein
MPRRHDRLRASPPPARLAARPRGANLAAVVGVFGLLAGVVGCEHRLAVLHSPPPDAEPFLRDAATAADGPADGDAGDDASSASAPAVRIVEPPAAATFTRDQVDPATARWVAVVTLRAETEAVARVEWRDVAAGRDDLLGVSDVPPFELVATLEGDGPHTLVARGLDAAGLQVAVDERGITLAPPSDDSCRAMLDALGLDWSPAPATRGVADPVRVMPTIDGVSFRYVSSATASAMLMDCSLAPRLVRLVQVLHIYDIVEVEHIGIYNYRCIGGGSPDTGCTPSQHAYAKAIDLHAFNTRDGAHLSTETDWVIRSGPTCPGAPANEEDRILHEIACTMWSEAIFQIVLTPNYNAAHRNHFHVDMTAGSRFIELSAGGVDPWVEGLGD